VVEPGVRIPPPSVLLRACASQDRVLVCAKQDALRSLSEGGSTLYYVYLIESLSAGRQRYVGMTDDLRQRLREHNAGESSYTAKFRPWKLTIYVAFTDPAKAEAFERYLKSGSGHAFARKRLW
jgi:putative endonuclease